MDARNRYVWKTRVLNRFLAQIIEQKTSTFMAGAINKNNLIEGSHDQVVEFLDRLSGKPGGTDKDQWREEVWSMYETRRGQK